MAIDREAIADGDLRGHPHAGDVVPRAGRRRLPRGRLRVLRARRRRGQRLLDEAGFDRSQPIELWFNAGAGHDAWMEAVGNQLRDNLGVEFALAGRPRVRGVPAAARREGHDRSVPRTAGAWTTRAPRTTWRRCTPPRRRRRPARTTASTATRSSTARRAGQPGREPTRRPSRRTRQAEDLLVEDMPDGAAVLHREPVGARRRTSRTSSSTSSSGIDAASVTVVG